MAREILEEATDENGNIVRLVSDTHDNPERTPRFFVESTVKFDEIGKARSLYVWIAGYVKVKRFINKAKGQQR